MKKIRVLNLILTIYFFISSSIFGDRIESIDNKIVKNNIAYVKGENTPFTGKFIGTGIEQGYKDGIKNGKYTGKIEIDGEVCQYIGNYVEGIKHGTWIIKYPNNENKAILEYNYDMPNNQWTYFYRNKQVEGYETFKDGILYGALVNYSENGNILKRANYENGFLQGELVFFHEGNILDTVANFSFGSLDGKIEIFSRENILQIEGNYKNNKREGIWKLYYKTGDLKVTIPYRNGLKTGKSIIYDKAGGVVQVNYYQNNNEVTSDGKLIKEAKPFKDGIVDRFKNFNKSLKYLKYNKILAEI